VPVATRPDARSLPGTRPRGRTAFLLPLPVAAAVGLEAGASPQATLTVVAAVVSAVVLVARVEWAALAVVATGVFEGYLDLVSPWATDWLAAVLLVSWAVRRAQGPLHPHRVVALGVPVAALGLALGAAFVAHPLGSDGARTCATYAELALVALVLADVLCGPLDPRRAARLYVLSCVAASVCGIVTAVLTERHRVVGPVESVDTMAFFLVAALPLVGTLRTRPDQRAWRVWTWLAVIVVAGVGTQSGAAFVALVGVVVGAVLTGALALRHAGALLALVTTGVALVVAVLPVSVSEVLADPHRYSDSNIAERNDVRRAALEMTRAAPVLGLGPGSFALFHQDYRHDGDGLGERELDTAYSTLLASSAELGLLGTAALYAGWLVPAVGAHRRRRRHRSQLTSAVLLALAGLLTASLLESEQFVLPLWFVAAMALAVGRPPLPRRPLFAVEPGEGSSGQVGPRS
jgi:O-antigen ligase